MPTCKQAVKMLSESLDHKLPLVERVGLRIHILICAACAIYERQMHFLRKAAHKFPEHQETRSAPMLSADGRGRIRATLRSEKRS